MSFKHNIISYAALPFLALWITQPACADSFARSKYTSIKFNPFWQEMDLDLRLNLDSTRFDGIFREDNQSFSEQVNDLRRARLFFKFDLNNNWSSKLQFAINEGDSKYRTKDAFFRYKGFDFADIKFGLSKEPFGLEQMTSSANLAFTERSLAKAFAPGRSKGINFSDSKSSYSWSIGAYDIEQGGNNKADGSTAYTTRVTLSPLNEENNYNHYGLSFSKRNLDGAPYEIKTNASLDTGFTFLDTRNIETESLQQSGLEAAWGRGALSLQGEYQHLNINAIEITENSRYQSYYTQLSYFLTQDNRPYKKGRFSSVRPSSSKGAWELVFRKGALQSINIGNEDPGTRIEVQSNQLGINYYLNKQAKLMLHINDSKTSGIMNGANADGSAITLRIQLRI